VVVAVSAGSRSARLGGRPSTLRAEEYPARRSVDTVAGRVEVDTVWGTRTVGDSGAPSVARSWRELEARVVWTRGRGTLEATLGARARAAGVPSTSWGQVRATAVVLPRVALSLGAGVYPGLVSHPAGRRFVSLGLRVAPPALVRPELPPGVRPTPAAFEVRPRAGGETVLSLRAPGARVVELTGDFTGWKPVAMRAVAGDRWELVTRLAPGVYRCNVRIDGDAWIAPPGTTAVRDDYEGQVGVIVVP
jgi:hypothetical protein